MRSMTGRVTLVATIVVAAAGCGYWSGEPTRDRTVAPAHWNTTPNAVSDKGAHERADDANAINAKERSVSRGVKVKDGEARAVAGPAPRACTVDQILVMKKAGLSDAQVRAACPE
jgi:hypothetical protein